MEAYTVTLNRVGLSTLKQLATKTFASIGVVHPKLSDMSAAERNIPFASPDHRARGVFDHQKKRLHLGRAQGLTGSCQPVMKRFGFRLIHRNMERNIDV